MVPQALAPGAPPQHVSPRTSKGEITMPPVSIWPAVRQAQLQVRRRHRRVGTKSVSDHAGHRDTGQSTQARLPGIGNERVHCSGIVENNIGRTAH